MRITDVRTIALKLPSPGDGLPTGKVTHSVNPIHIFPDLRPGRGPSVRRQQRANMLIVKVVTDEGITGFSNTNIAVGPISEIVQQFLGPLIVGHDPFDTELLWERMYRGTIVMGSRGVATEAISLVDIALWDIKGKALGVPVYKLLGGKTSPRIRTYASRLYGPDVEFLREEAAGYVQQGFTAVKQRFAYGPAAGVQGMRKNYELVKAVREAIGPDVELMVDCCRSFDAPYAIKMIRMVEEFDLTWVEEPVLPHDIPGYVTVRNAVNVPISGGEHEFTRYGFREWLEKGAADIIQPDVNRAGGLSEVTKICAMASAWGVPVIPHGGQMHNYHFVASHMNAPLAEYFPHSKDGRDGNAGYWQIVLGEPVAKDGYVELPDRPGLGLELNQDAIKRYQVDH